MKVDDMISQVKDGKRRKFSIFLKGTLGIFLLAFQLSCSGGGNESFKFAGDDSQASEITKPVEIVDFTPKDDPVIVTNSGFLTFAVTVGSGAGNNLEYTFALDGTVVQTGSNGFYDLNQSTVGMGDHTLEVLVTNGLTEDSHTFNLTKNTPAVIDSTSPAASGNTVSCGGGTLDLTVDASDINGDTLDFVWKYNSAVFPAAFSSIVSTASQSVATFAPSCVLSGAGTVSVDVSDGYDVVSYTWSVNVLNPIIAQITAFTPATSPIIIPSVGSQLFSIFGTAKSPYTFAWLLDGTPIGGATSSFYTLSAGSVTVGPHTLTGRLSDSDSEDEHVFNLVRNAPPELTNPDPASTDTKMNYLSTKTFSIDATDDNGDTLTYTWTVDGSVSGALLDSGTPTGSQAVFDPDATFVGAHTIRVRVSDGTEYTDYQWSVEVNYFSDACNNLEAGQICTLVGKVGLGSGSFPMSKPELVKMHPSAVESDGVAGVFIADRLNHIVWYYNLSGATVNRLGIDVEPQQIVAVVGNGATGTTPNGSQNNLYKLNTPEGLAWDSATQSLFIAEYGKHIVSWIRSTGVGMQAVCSGGTGSNAPAGGQALLHDCRNVTAVEVDAANRLLYVSVYNNNAAANSHIRVFDISDADPNNWTGSIFVTGASGAADGTIGGTARADRVWAMDTDSRGVLYWLDGNSGCSVRVANTTAAPISFFGGGQLVSVAAGQTASLTGNGCAAGIGTLANTGFAANSRGLSVVERTPGVIEGWFVSNLSNDRITFINNTSAMITYGGADIAAYESGYVTHTAAGFNGQQLGKDARTNEPYGVAFLSFYNALAFGDYTNFRFRALDLSTTQGQIATLAGEDRKYGNSGDGSKAPNDMVIQNPRGLAVDTLQKVLYFADTTNGRVRAVDLTTGLVTTALGRGRNTALSGVNPENALDVYTGNTGPRRLFAIGNGGLLWVDRDGGGANKSCVVRAYNPLQSALNFLNVLIGAGKVASVIGDWAFGCADHTDGVVATLSALNQPEGVIYDGQNVYVTVEGSDCILKVSVADQKISPLVGLCGSVGYQDGLLTDPAVRLRDPSALALDPTYAADGNFYFVDAYNSGTSYLRYVNQRPTSVEISGVTIPGNSVGTLVTSGSNFRIKAVAAFDSQYCFSRGQDDLGPHNVICRNRDDDLGNTTLRVGSSDSSPVQAGTPMGTEQEGISSSNATLYEPIGLAFDAEGNLYISEEDSHQIRKVKKWW